MSKYKGLTNIELKNTLQQKSQAERSLTVEVIELLEEMERRKSYFEFGFPSLMDFCIHELKYSESAAYRRISAMRISRELPEVKSALDEGRLNLVNLAQAQTLFKFEAKNNNPYSKEKKQTLLKSLENKSKREAEKILATESPRAIPKESIKVMTTDKIHLNLVIDQNLLDKLNRIKNFTSHQNPNSNYAELLELMADIALAKLDPLAKKRKDKKLPSQRKATPPAVSKPVVSKNPRYVSANIKRIIWQRAEGKCTHIDEKTGRQCLSQFQLEIDHKIPLAKGGTSVPENLRLVCHNHNFHYARQQLGEIFMNQFIKK